MPSTTICCYDIREPGLILLFVCSPNVGKEGWKAMRTTMGTMGAMETRGTMWMVWTAGRSLISLGCRLKPPRIGRRTGLFPFSHYRERKVMWSSKHDNRMTSPSNRHPLAGTDPSTPLLHDTIPASPPVWQRFGQLACLMAFASSQRCGGASALAHDMMDNGNRQVRYLIRIAAFP